MSFRKIKTLDREKSAILKAERQKLYETIAPKNGVDGVNGRDGLNGKDGLNGINGKDGKDGKDGANGDDGRGITKAKIIKEDLWIYYDDGTKENVGKVVGRDGMNGRSIMALGQEITRVTTITSESITAQDNYYIRQTVSGITTTLTCNKTNAKFYIKNYTEDTTTISASIDGYSSIILTPKESLTLIYNGDGSFDII